jgi:hypothetical protein
MPLERFLRIASAENVPHNVSVTNSIRFGSGKAASTRDKIESRKLTSLLPYQRLRSWLGREDSNLRMAESKSEWFAFEIKAHSEKSPKFESISINKLVHISEFNGLSPEPDADKLRKQVATLATFGGHASSSSP